MVFKKDLTPIGRKGTVTKHKGKGATEQRNRPGARETLTGGSPLARTLNAYPKPAPAPPAPPAPAAGPGLTPPFGMTPPREEI